MSIHHTIEPQDQDKILKRWLQTHYPQITFSQWQKWFRTGQIRLDGKRVKGNEALTTGQQLRLPPVIQRIPVRQSNEHAPSFTPSEKELAEFKQWIVEETKDYVVINKPAGLAVQGGSNIQKHVDGFLDLMYPGASAKLVHRLDKETSGLLLIAKTHQAAQHMAAGFQDKSILKTYLAVVQGVPKRQKGSVLNYLKKIKEGGVERICVVPESMADAKYSETRYEVLATNSQDNIALLQLAPLTGRMHQLRVHCQALSCPILGDLKYNPKTTSKKLHLHACRIQLPEILGNKVIEAPLPDYFEQTLKLFNLKFVARF